MRRAYIILTAALIVCAPVARGASTLYRLPVRSVLDTAVVELFEAALDTVLAARFRVVVPTDSTPHHPDSAVCAAELTEADSGGLRLSYDLYQAGREDVVSGELIMPPERLDFAEVVLAIQNAFAPSGFVQRSLARLRIDGVRDSKVYLDGALYGTIPFEAFVIPGEHAVAVSGRRFLRHAFTIDMAAGGDTLAVVDLRQLSRPLRAGLAILGGTAAGSALYAHRVQDALYDRYADPTRTRSDFDRRYRDYRKAVVIRNLLAAVGAGALSAAVVLTFDIP